MAVRRHMSDFPVLECKMNYKTLDFEKLKRTINYEPKERESDVKDGVSEEAKIISKKERVLKNKIDKKMEKKKRNVEGKKGKMAAIEEWKLKLEPFSNIDDAQRVKHILEIKDDLSEREAKLKSLKGNGMPNNEIVRKKLFSEIQMCKTKLSDLTLICSDSFKKETHQIERFPLFKTNKSPMSYKDALTKFPQLVEKHSDKLCLNSEKKSERIRIEMEKLRSSISKQIVKTLFERKLGNETKKLDFVRKEREKVVKELEDEKLRIVRSTKKSRSMKSKKGIREFSKSVEESILIANENRFEILNKEEKYIENIIRDTEDKMILSSSNKVQPTDYSYLNFLRKSSFMENALRKEEKRKISVKNALEKSKDSKSAETKAGSEAMGEEVKGKGKEEGEGIRPKEEGKGNPQEIFLNLDGLITKHENRIIARNEREKEKSAKSLSYGIKLSARREKISGMRESRFRSKILKFEKSKQYRDFSIVISKIGEKGLDLVKRRELGEMNRKIPGRKVKRSHEEQEINDKVEIIKEVNKIRDRCNDLINSEVIDFDGLFHLLRLNSLRIKGCDDPTNYGDDFLLQEERKYWEKSTLQDYINNINTRLSFKEC